MDQKAYAALLDIYWQKIVEAKNYDPQLQSDLSQRMGQLVKTEADECLAMQMQAKLYQRKINQ